MTMAWAWTWTWTADRRAPRFALVALVAFVARLVWYAICGAHPWVAEGLIIGVLETVNLAIGVATRGAMAGVLPAYPDLPSAWVPPGYVLWLAGVLWFWADRIGPAAWTILACHAALDAMVTGLVWALATRVMGTRAGWIAASLHLLSPAVARYGLWPWHTPFDSLTVALLGWRALDTRDDLRSDIVDGVLLAMGIHFTAAVPFVAPVFLATRMLSNPLGLVAGLRSSAVIALTLAVGLAPWAVRNQLSLGSPVVTRTTLPIAASFGNRESERLRPLWSIYDSGYDIMQYVTLGEIGYRNACRESAIAEIRSHPRDFLVRSVDRFVTFWGTPPLAERAARLVAPSVRPETIRFHGDPPLIAPTVDPEEQPDAHAAVQLIWFAVAYAGALLGACRLVASGRAALVAICAACLLLSSGLYTVTLSADRYRVPFEVIVCVLAGGAALRLESRGVPG